MGRKHENFTYQYGWKTAPEQYRFFINGKLINLASDIRNKLGYMVICGKSKEAEDELKRLLRKEEKKNNDFVTIGFFYKENNKRYVYTMDLIAKRNDKKEMLSIYKRFKDYCKKQNCKVSTHTVTSGFITPYGTEQTTIKNTEELVDVNKPCLIKVEYGSRMFI